RGGQLAPQDARGAAAVRGPAPAHRSPDPGAADDQLALPAGALRPAAGGRAPEPADACARLSLGDGERALALALGEGPALRARAEAFARAPLAGRAHA